jgi:hypothetical protein
MDRRKANYLFIFIIVISCGTTFSYLNEKVDFKTYADSFEAINAINADSTYMDSVMQYNLFKPIDKQFFAFIKASMFIEKCTNYKKYIFHKVGRLNSNTFLYYLKLNPKCQYDGYEGVFLLCKYNERGKIVFEKAIGGYTILFEYRETTYFKRIDANTIKITEVVEKSFPGDSTYLKKDSTFIFHF